MATLRRVLFPLSLGFVFVASLLVAPAGAVPTVRYVDNTVACDNGTSDSGTTPYCDIWAAVVAASPGDTIDIGPGTYSNSSGGSAVVWLNSRDLDLVGSGQGVTIIEGADTNIGIRIDNSSVAVSDLTIANGFSPGSGGGLYVVNGDEDVVTVTDVTIGESTATWSGGGLLASGEVHLDRVTIEGCSAVNGGGGIALDGGKTMTVTDSSFTDNVSSNVAGGGIAAASGSSLTIQRSVFEGNDGLWQGGALYLDMGSSTAYVIDSTFAGNGDGGITYDGGAIYVKSGALEVIGSLFVGNSAIAIGGAIAVGSAGTLNLRSSTVSGNWAAQEGGGIGEAQGVVSGSTITGNSTDGIGGGLTRGITPPIVKNTIIAGNTASGSAPDCEAVDSQGHNLIGDTSGCAITGVTTGNQLNAAPMLGVLDDNGGPTLTHALLDGSPALDSGDPGTPDGAGTHCEELDQRGWDRDGDERTCDIGAYERLRCGGLDITLAGTPGVDELVGTTGDDVIAGFGGDDIITALAGNDRICGGAGADTLRGGYGSDRIYGGSGSDLIWGGPRRDRVNGGWGRDTIYGGGGSDILKGAGSLDRIWGGPAGDYLYGGIGNDKLRGEDGDDSLAGMAGDDLLVGGPGYDQGTGGDGTDRCYTEVAAECE